MFSSKWTETFGARLALGTEYHIRLMGRDSEILEN